MPNDNDLCANCGQEYWQHHEGIYCISSKNTTFKKGYVVPASLLDKVRALCDSAPVDEHAHRVMVLYSALAAVREALAEIEKGVAG